MASGTIQNIPVVKYHDTGSMKLNNLSWTATTSGKYAAPVNVSGISGRIISVCINGISRLKTTDIIIPYITGQTSVSLMANTSSFDSAGNGAQISLMIVYI